MKKAPEKEKFEYCVMCGKPTPIKTSLHIDFREDYITGCGQICNSCRLKLQNKINK